MKWNSPSAKRRPCLPLVAASVLLAFLLAAGAPSQALPQTPPSPARAERARDAAATGQTGTPAPPPAATKPVPPAANPQPPADTVDSEEPPAAAPQGPQPPDGKWLKDAEGREYFLEKLPKTAGTYQRLDAKTVRTLWGIPIDVAKEDDQFFYYKVYRLDPAALGPQPDQEPTPEQQRAVAETYRVDTPESRRLHFAPFSSGLPTGGQWRNGFAIADMNGDGHPDIVHPPARKSMSNPSIFLGDGHGNWRRWREAKFPPLPFDYGDAAVGDLNGDGHMDIVLGMHLRGIVALLGDGKGNFTDWSKGLDLQRQSDEDAAFSSRAVAVVHWNHDKRLDILALGEGPRLATSGENRLPAKSQSFGTVIYLNQGDGTWKRKDQGTGRQQIFGDSIATGDFNGDHRPDFATGSNLMGAKALVNLSRADGGWDTQEIDVMRPSAYVNAVAVADFDRDGRDDLAVGYLSYELQTWRSGVDIYYSRRGGKWERRALVVEEGREGFTALATGDLDRDGNRDLVALTGDGRTLVFLGNGKGGFTREAAAEIPPVEGGCRGYHVELADLDGDGRDEIVAGFAGENSPMFAPNRCLSGGALTAWHVQQEQPAARP
jgi:VCBS repeat protein/FG-GAP repeat protein